MAGYSSTPLFKKLGIKEGFRVGFFNAPNSFWRELGKLPDTVKTIERGNRLNLVVLFADSERLLTRNFSKLAGKLVSDGMLWVAWPKKSSARSTDLSFNVVQRVGLNNGLVDVKVCAIDDVWSALKFVYRKKDRPT